MPVDTPTAPEQDVPNPYPSECDVVKGEAEVAQEGPRPLPLKYVCVDTETSGLFDFSKPADADGQPRMASLSMIFCNEHLDVVGEFHALIKPDGWVIDPGAAAANGLTLEQLEEDGIPVREALDHYAAAVDDGNIVVAFNSQFDTKVLRGEMRRAGIDDRFEKTPNICTMRSLVGVCKIPKANGRGYKFPKLVEACAHFKIEIAGAHTSSGDAWACYMLARRMKQLGLLPEPEVHYAKNRPTPDGAPLREALERSVEVEREKSGYRIET